MSAPFRTSAVAPWTGLFVGAGAWFADHQLSSDGNFWNCAQAGGAFTVGVGVVCFAIAVAGGLASRLARPESRADEAETRGFARVVGTAAAAIFALAIAFGTWAGVLLPGCQR